VRVVGDGATDQPSSSGQPIGDPFDEAEGGGGGAQGGGEEAWQQGGGDLVADVGQEAGRADPGHPRPKPAFLGGGVAHGGSLAQRDGQPPGDRWGLTLQRT
jgi:hypothetical protein